MALAIVDYATYIDLLASAPGELGWKCVHALAGVGLLLIAGLWLPGLLLGDRDRETGDSLGDAGLSGAGGVACWLALAVAGGVISSVTFWTVSLFAFKQAGPGNVGVIGLAIFGLVRAVRSSVRRGRALAEPMAPVGPAGDGWSGIGLVIAVACVAFALGFWLVAATELRTGDRVWYCDRHRDVSVHVHATSVIAASGLPRLNRAGLAGEPYNALCHTGYAALTAGFSEITGISLYQSFAGLWIAGFAAIGWSSLALVGRFQLSRFVSFACGVVPLFWARLGWPAFSVLLDPAAATSYPGPPYAAAMMYHSFPQVWSIALVSAGLVCLDLSSTLAERKTLALAAATLTFVLSGWIKPSLVILIGPALLIYLVLNRRRGVHFAVVLCVLAAGLAVYMLPAFLEHLPRHPGWSVSPSLETIKAATRFFGLGLGAGLLYVAARLWGLWRNRKSGLALDSGDTVLIAAGGGWLFALLFTEERFGSQQPNVWWGLAGCLVLLSPYVTAWCGNSRVMSNRAPSPGWLRRTGCVMVGVQLLAGFVLAATYPLLNLRAHRVSLVEALREAGEATPPGTTFYVDPGSVRLTATTAEYVDRGLGDVDLVGYLARPVLYLTAMSADAELEEMRIWRAFVRTGDERLLQDINRRGAIVLHASRSAARRALLDHGWVLSRSLSGNYELFEQQQH